MIAPNTNGIPSTSKLDHVTEYHIDNNYLTYYKRILDLFISFMLLPPFLISLPVIALIIISESRGPVFFTQKRIGKTNQAFVCYKFRTMYLNNQSNSLPVQKGDKRITKMGYYFRKYFIDEWPQIINVIKGDMSFVGPRPLMIQENIHFEQIVPDFDKRYEVKPGITGLAQMQGLYGIMKDYETLVLRQKVDLNYIKKATFQLDLYILWNTIFKTLPKARPRNA